MRQAVSLAVVAVGTLVTAGRAGAAVPGTTKPAARCQAAVRVDTRLAPPTSLQTAATTIARRVLDWDAAEVESVTPNRSSGWVSAVERGLINSGLLADPTNLDAGSIPQALLAGDGPLATQLLHQLRGVYASIDRHQKKEKLPAACSSQAFGAAYMAQVGALVQADLPLTGAFATDADAACSRLDQKISMSSSRVDLTDLSSVTDLVGNLTAAFRAFQVDLQAIPPPGGSAAPYAAFQGLVDQAVQKLTLAQRELNTNASAAQLQSIGNQISILGDPLTAAAGGLGLTC